MIRIEDFFAGYPSQLKVAELMLQYGISVRENNAYVGTVKIADAALASATGVDRRVVRSTIERISMGREINALFSKIAPMAVLSEAADLIGCTSLEIVPEDDARPGILAEIMGIISSAGLNIRQAVVSKGKDDPVSHLIIVVVGTVPGEVLASIKESPNVARIVL